MRVKILVRLKEQILEPQGKNIEESLNNLGFSECRNVRQGKLIELDLPEDIKNKSTYIKDICSKLLVNDIIEEYEVL